MKRLFAFTAAALIAATTAAHAVDVSNADAEAVIIVVTENGERNEVEIAPGAAMELCLTGCFVSFPAGGMLALTGDEKVVVEQGEGKISGE